MREAVELLKREFLTLGVGLQKLRDLKEAIKKTEDASLVKSLAKDVESVLTEFSEITNLKETFLKEKRQNNIEEYLEAQRLQKNGEVVMRLLVKVQQTEKELAEELFTAKELLKRSSAYIDYQINVTANVKADTTYGPPGKSQDSAGAKKMFDANV